MKHMTHQTHIIHNINPDATQVELNHWLHGKGQAALNAHTLFKVVEIKFHFAGPVVIATVVYEEPLNYEIPTHE